MFFFFLLYHILHKIANFYHNLVSKLYFLPFVLTNILILLFPFVIVIILPCILFVNPLENSILYLLVYSNNKWASEKFQKSRLSVTLKKFD